MLNLVDKNSTVAIIGGGECGMLRALRLAEEGRTVTIFEAQGRLGGELNAKGVPQFNARHRARLHELIVAVCRNKRVYFRLNCLTEPQALRAQGFSEIELHTGRPRPLRPNFACSLPYLPWERVMRPDLDPDLLRGKRVCVIGSGRDALDCARYVKMKGARRVWAVSNEAHTMPVNGVNVLTASKPLRTEGEYLCVKTSRDGSFYGSPVIQHLACELLILL